MNRFNSNRRVPILAKWTFCFLFSLVTAITNQAGADEAIINNDVLAKSERATNDELDALRGGFVLPNGVNLDFSIEKIILINGVVASSASFQLTENMSSLQNMSVVQNGLQNVAPALQGSTLGSVVQNNMDNQTISNLNTINIELSNVKSLDTYYKSVSIQDSMLHY